MMDLSVFFVVFLIIFSVGFHPSVCDEIITIDDSPGLGRTFDGIGAISGGGATSKLLINYPEKERNEILDFLFKPNFGASLHILKVEIGGDAQSTEGTEASHMHVPWEENYERGYEWWLMKEAKKRNPNIQLYALPWAFPAWVGHGSGSPYKYKEETAMYILKWILGAKKVHNLTMDYIGIWNERAYDINYILYLRKRLDSNGFSHIKLVAADGTWKGIVADVLKNETLAKVVDFIGTHYPGTTSTSDAVKTGIQLWASEDYSTLNNNVGAGCWARILNQNYVNGMMTGTIAWNLIAAYYRSLPFGRSGLMTAEEPWSGHYDVSNPIWITAHTTQFTKIGWSYLKHGYGVGKLPKGGSYVSLLSPDKKDFTLIIETMTREHSPCVRPYLPPYDVAPQHLKFQLRGSLASVKELYIWSSKLEFGTESNKTVMFKKAVPGPVYNGTFSFFIDVDSIITVTTVATGNKGVSETPPQSKNFPLPYYDNFENSALYGEANNFAQQVGAFEIQRDVNPQHKQVLRQMVLELPIHWCQVPMENPVTLMGNINWTDVAVQADVMVPKINGSKGVFIAARLDRGGCLSFTQRGIYFVLYPAKGTFTVYNDLTGVIALKSGSFDTKLDTWYTMTLVVKGPSVTGYIDGRLVFTVDTPKWPTNGFAGLGTDGFGYASFDNFSVIRM